ncbi:MULTISPECIES: sigma-70 family RNA polymerase sigma factor [Pseudomonas]|uniref:RNA polymerase subunit sigma n=1 Tax=Pseudomonas frederiksbergensis TaxID=104087 RepID=A0A2S8H3L6_9PSED|nr:MULTISPECIES: sigma-70 family RNA polymerase sigma factor [Pseudomonas]PQO95972.1 RNA polymerase subunit sigma [Pseudomonas frederiksbergensis]WLG47100.1 sigma-70 family RNA polymerase sigma factor [Pseudomonas sp. FP1740]WLG48829.1 sigma-70 family RNA polymerase sigma factor [Pseudomonas sp. FP1742]
MSDAAMPKEQTLHDLYRDHRGWLEGWLRRRMGNAFDAADLSQDTFLRLLASSQRISDLQEPRAYLLTVGKRLLSNFYQRRSLEQAYLNALASLPEGSVPSPEQRWLLLETLQTLDELLDGLPTAVRRAFLWSQLEGLNYQQIAERLRVSERTIKRYMAQAYEHCLLVEM